MALGVLASAIVSNSPVQAQSFARGGTALDTRMDPGTMVSTAADNQSPPIEEAFWATSPIELSRFSELFPYQLLVLRASKSPDGSTTHSPEPGWVYTLPMPPEAMQISMPFAIEAYATMGGIIEEHNAAPFRMITLRGTTGLLPARASAPQQLGFGLLEAIAGGTLTALQDVKAALSTPSVNPNVHLRSEFDDTIATGAGAGSILARTSGYAQFRKLQRFLEAYAAIKKTKAGRDLRLALAIWKDQAVYVCAPQAFDVSKDGGSPLEYKYVLSLKAWRRVTINTSTFGTVSSLPVRRDPNAMARLLNDLRAARRVVQGLTKAATAVVGDADRLIFEPLREASLFLKDSLGLAITIADLPDSLVKRMKASWVEMQGTNAAVLANAAALNDRVKRLSSLGNSAANETSTSVSEASRVIAAEALSAHPAGAAFNTVKASFDLMEKADISSMNPPAALVQQISAERLRVQNLRRADFEARRDQVGAAAAALAAGLGAGSDTYNAVYSLNVKPLKKAPTQSDWDALFALNSALMALDALAATGDGEPSAREGKMVVMAGLARRSGIAFQVPVSKYAVPFPYGTSLEGLAQTYLGDRERWHEIATLNGLQAPYVDEVGFDLPIAVNGNGNEVVVNDSTNLFVGQPGFVWSDTARRTRRTIIGLRPVGNQTVVTVDGPPDMGSFKASEGGKLSAFLPGTVNSQALIYIPSTQEPTDDNFVTKAIPNVNEFDPLTAAGGVSLLLDSHNNIVLAPDGTSRLAIGLTNIIQNTRIALSVRQGTLPGHPDFGLDAEVGMSLADFNAKSVLSSVRRMLSRNPAYSAVNAVQVVQNGPTAAISVSVSVQGSRKPIPLSYQVRGDFQTMT